MHVQLFSIGHSNHTDEKLLSLLQLHGIACLADVRSAPYSRYNPQFNRERLAAFLQENGIDYAWLGDSLGGRRKTGDEYAYDAVFKQGLQQLLHTGAAQVTAMMCSEEDPRHCHRHHIICSNLVRHGHPAEKLVHIRGNGSLETAAGIITVRQQKLF